MSEFAVKIVERPAVKTAGIKLHTTMEKASVDCPAIWEKFMPHMEAFPCDGAGLSYGLCIMTSETEFDYWAVLPLGKDANVPAGLEEITIPAGFYAQCPLKSLAEMGEAYNYLNTKWSGERKDYAVDFQGMGLELYGKEYMENGSLTLCVPLLRK